MGSFSNGTYVPAIGETGWGTNVNDYLTRSGEASINVKQLPYAAQGDGTTDDSASFTLAANAAGAGGTIVVPPGTFILNDWTPAQQVHIAGSGMPSPGGSHGTTLKAKAGATWVTKLLGFYNPTIQDLAIDGNGRASSGVLVQGTGGSTSQGATFQNVEFYRCNTAAKLDASTSQADKNTFIRCRVDESLTGINCVSSNTQFTTLIQVVIGANVGVTLSGGTLTWIGGGVGSSTGPNTIGLQFTNPNVKYVTLVDIINEYSNASTDIDGSAAWPVQGVDLNHCVLTGSQAAVKMGQNSAALYARQTQFNTASVLATANDTLFHDEGSLFLGGAVYTPSGSNNRRHQWDNNGLTVYGGAAGTTVTHRIINATGDNLIAHSAGKVGFYGATTVAKQTGVAVSAAGIHAALVNLGLISA